MVLLLEVVNVFMLCFFFFQAEDGIRDHCVTEFRRVLFRSVLARLVATDHSLARSHY